MQQSEHPDPVRSPDVHLPIGDGGHNKFVTCPEMIASVRSLIAVVEFGQIPCVVSVEYGDTAVLRSPDNAIARTVRRDAWTRSRIGKTICALRGGRQTQLGV